jgi:hypothetical protein
MLRSAEHVTGRWRYKRIGGASHWMQLDAAERIDELLLERGLKRSAGVQDFAANPPGPN